MVDKKLVKSAGEHWTCAVLSRFGWSTALTRDGVERTDILAVRAETGRMIAVQVKTASFVAKQRFFLGAKSCAPALADNEWFVLVALAAESTSPPRSFVVPRDHVAAATWIQHQEWATNPTVPSGKRNTPITGARVSDWVFARYEDRWDLLDRPPSKAPVMLPPRFRGWATGDRVGLPPDHPWLRRLPAWDNAEESPHWPSWAAETGLAGTA